MSTITDNNVQRLAPSELPARQPVTNGHAPQQQSQPQLRPAVPLPTHDPLNTCDHCDAQLDQQQRYCLSCGSRNRHVVNPAVEHLSGIKRKSALPADGGDDSVFGSSINKGALPWLIGFTVCALVTGLIIGGGRGDNKDLIAALANQKPIVVGAAAPTAATGPTAGTGDEAADEDFAEELETDNGKESPLAVKVTKKKVAEDKKAVEELSEKEGEEYVEGQNDLPDAIVNDDPNAVPESGAAE